MWRLCALVFVASASAQIPSLGWCPDFQPMANFNMNRFLGTWFEAERYFTVSELATRCVTTNYISTPEGRILVSNEITNSFTGLKRVMEGSLQLVGREGEGRIMVKYSQLPLPYESEFAILDTDYDSYAVMWSCSGIGPVHTQNTWLLTRDRLPSLGVMQNAYAVLDRYKISRTFFVKTNQADCTILPEVAALPVAERSGDDVVEEAKSVGVVSDDVVVEKQVNPEVKPVVSEVKPVVPEVAQERTANADPVPVPKEEAKIKKVPELILSAEKKEEKMDKIEEPKPEKAEKEVEIPPQ